MEKNKLKEFVRNRLNKKKIILFGAGAVAEKFYDKYKDIFDIELVVSNIKKEWGPQKFKGALDVKKYEKELLSDDCYLVVCGPIAFRDIELQLIDDGLVMYEDYIESQIAELLYQDKKIALLYGQCILRDIYKCLLEYGPFTDIYAPMFTQIVMGQVKMVNRVLMYVKDFCDLYVYTPKILDKDSIYAISPEELPPDCQIISISNLVVSIYWPEIDTKMGNFNPMYYYPYEIKRDSIFGHTLYRHEDLNINKMLIEGMEKKEILKRLCDENFYSPEKVYKAKNVCMKLIAMAERNVDVKIYDFIETNYKTVWLYQNFLHPQKTVIMEYIKRFLIEIGIDTTQLSELNNKIPSHTHHGGDVPIYPSVIKGLELSFIPENFKYEVIIGDGVTEMTFEEYMEHYIDYTRIALNINRLL